ncbi:MAG: hypothetical protein K8F54_11420 [Altibacter sp.]|uniref:hypothetical protein n=1 Tax=Altibacter sp. TaxID=2024823 RepID=UPI001D409807|nr:hypothetical protein [Altibacter sp.]MBZ0328208.1 hypothetical protein [Altibacter sp.]
MAKPANCISETEARTLYNNWDNRATLINNNLAPDVRDVIFSVEELEAYLKYVKENHVGMSKQGIRIYFAAYNNAQSTKATVFLAPTNGTSANAPNNYAIEALNKGQGGWPPNIY